MYLAILASRVQIDAKMLLLCLRSTTIVHRTMKTDVTAFAPAATASHASRMSCTERLVLWFIRASVVGGGLAWLALASSLDWAYRAYVGRDNVLSPVTRAPSV
jgi:hypothetical protein